MTRSFDRRDINTLRDELRKAADKNHERPDWTKTRMPTISAEPHTHGGTDAPECTTCECRKEGPVSDISRDCMCEKNDPNCAECWIESLPDDAPNLRAMALAHSQKKTSNGVSETKYYTSGGVVVTWAQREAARLMRNRALNGLSATRTISPATHQIADAKPKKASTSTNMIHARELDITGVTTVSDLFELIDLPYRITKKATLSIKQAQRGQYEVGTTVLRLEWRGEGVYTQDRAGEGDDE